MVASISVRGLDDGSAARLKVRAARNGRSMEAEVRAIITAAVAPAQDARLNIAQAVRKRFAETGGVDLELPVRSAMPRAAQLPNLP